MEQLSIITVIMAALVNLTAIVGLHVKTQARLIRVEVEVNHLVEQIKSRK